MFNNIKTIAVVLSVFSISACAQMSSDVEEFVVVDPAPVTTEPVFTGKY